MRQMKFLLLLALLLPAASVVQAAAPPSPAPVSIVAGYVPISVSSVSARGALPGTAAALLSATLDNIGTADAFCAAGTSSVVATTSSPIFVGAGKHVDVYVGAATNIACITASSTTTINAYHANGPINLGGAGAGGGALPAGAATAANQPTNVTQGASTSGETGNLGMRATLTGAAAYTTATTNPAITDTHGSDPVTLRDSTGAAIDLTQPSGVYQTIPSAAALVTVSSGNVANASAAASLPAVSGKTNCVRGFMLTASGATAGLDVNVTLAGLAGGTMTFTFTFPVGAAVGASPLSVNFPSCFPASATNTAITVTLPAGGTGNTNAAANIWGYVQ